ncbi:MAG: hypothetical protein Q7U02_01260 [Desulfosalsimonadaceae bacterium]|nr:hypothetical protein [Desulfosalsimonadaceae bacterium]
MFISLSMNDYQAEQLEALRMVRQILIALPDAEAASLKAEIADYREFRTQVGGFLDVHFKDICTEKCFQSRLSACCSKDGIIAFFGDVAVNALVSDDGDLDRIEAAIQNPASPVKCIFLAEGGCLWRIKPAVCTFFLCDEAENRAFGDNPEAAARWAQLKEIKKHFTWPDKPVLFERLESFFLTKGCRSPLMYLHFSPGLSRIRQNRKDLLSNRIADLYIKNQSDG